MPGDGGSYPGQPPHPDPQPEYTNNGEATSGGVIAGTTYVNAPGGCEGVDKQAEDTDAVGTQDVEGSTLVDAPGVDENVDKQARDTEPVATEQNTTTEEVKEDGQGHVEAVDGDAIDTKVGDGAEGRKDSKIAQD